MLSIDLRGRWQGRVGIKLCADIVPLSLGLLISPGSPIVFGVGAPQRFRPSPSMGPRMDFSAALTLQLDQASVDLQERLTLGLTAYIPRENFVYFRTCGSLGAIQDVHVRLPNLKTLDLNRVPLSRVFPIPYWDPSDMQETLPPSLDHIFLQRPLMDGFTWLPLTEYLSQRKASGNQLSSLIEGPCHICRRETHGVRALVLEFEIADEFSGNMAFR